MAITSYQQGLLARHNVSYTRGLTSSEASQRRSRVGEGGLNTVQPPLNCPKWICCLLPCINHIPSMKQFRLVQPDDAELLRDGKWIRYDHTSLVAGDIVRLVEGDVIPADVVVISLGMDHVDATKIVEVGDDATNNDGDSSLDMTVDSHFITGETKPRQVSNAANGTVKSITTLYYGSRVLEGTCIALVTATGNQVLLARLISEGRWPPKGDLSDEVELGNTIEDEDVEAGISLLPMS
eukprot:g5997.t1 g5997   contig20:590148-590985(+)